MKRLLLIANIALVTHALIPYGDFCATHPERCQIGYSSVDIQPTEKDSDKFMILFDKIMNPQTLFDSPIVRTKRSSEHSTRHRRHRKKSRRSEQSREREEFERSMDELARREGEREKEVLVVPPRLPGKNDLRSKDRPAARAAVTRTAFEMEDGNKPRMYAASSDFPVFPSDSSFGANEGFKSFDKYTDSSGRLHRPRSRSPFTKPGLWEPNPDNPHNRDHANKWWYNPHSVTADWLNGQLFWNGHWAVPAIGTGGTDGASALHFPTIGTFLNIPDDYD